MAKRGRKSKAEELGLEKLLDECWTEQERRDTLKKLVSLANRGNMSAIQLLMAYTYGKPLERHEVSGKDGDAIQITVTYRDRTSGFASGAEDDQD